MRFTFFRKILAPTEADNKRFHRFHRKMYVRHASHSGSWYTDNPSTLQRQLQGECIAGVTAFPAAVRAESAEFLKARCNRLAGGCGERGAGQSEGHHRTSRWVQVCFFALLLSFRLLDWLRG
jgi:hypothetical protein